VTLQPGSNHRFHTSKYKAFPIRFFSAQNEFNADNLALVIGGMQKFYANHGCKEIAYLNDLPELGSGRTLSKTELTELLGLVLGVAMQCD